KRKKFTFYDGPPFATGLPHYGHIVASTIKDIIPRYMTQNGFYVERRFGWDTHGLPIEFEIEKKLGIKTKNDVLKYGIGNYNEECRSIVLKFREEWRDTIRRLGRWVDFDNDYKTMDKSFMESVWWVFSELYNKKLIYRGVKVMPYSNGCTTPLSNFEATSNYKTVSDPSVVIKFKTDGGKFDNNILLVWTTTPWTLPSNLAICVNPKLKYYCLISHRDDCSYIIAKDCLTNYFKNKEEYTIKYELDGIELVGQTYNPLFNYFEGRYPNSFEIVSDSYVEATSGTGLVHIAPAFGKDDYRVCLEKNIISKDVSPPCPLNENGYFTEVVSDFKNMYIKDADKDIISYLKNNDNIFTSRKENHEYPFCWRSNTPLIYKTTPSWFVNVESIR
ncbi:class I tRNA ligase family protein, partial [Winogradskyella sp.]|uniref:class I tRNA ligase family protein n=1 Tax=Winogradskyella sp. TaxID=1883156 RepID=UPI003F69888C